MSSISRKVLTFAVQLLTIRVGAQVLGGVDQLVQLRLLLLQLAQDVLRNTKPDHKANIIAKSHLPYARCTCSRRVQAAENASVQPAFAPTRTNRANFRGAFPLIDSLLQCTATCRARKRAITRITNGLLSGRSVGAVAIAQSREFPGNRFSFVPLHEGA